MIFHNLTQYRTVNDNDSNIQVVTTCSCILKAVNAAESVQRNTVNI